jgi:SRSO17 transposase
VDADAVRDDVREYVLEHLHDEGAVLVVDETGDVKKGTHTVGVQRQYTGTAGRIENAQVAVYLVYAGLGGHAAVDRELYIPRSWTCDADRCRAAGLGEDTVFATKPELAARMIGRFLDAGHRVGWVAADEVYGGSRGGRGGRSAVNSPDRTAPCHVRFWEQDGSGGPCAGAAKCGDHNPAARTWHLRIPDLRRQCIRVPWCIPVILAVVTHPALES